MKKTAPIAFAGSQLDESRHVRAFFNNDDGNRQDEFALRRVICPMDRATRGEPCTG